jgi:hypothetical protein
VSRVKQPRTQKPNLDEKYETYLASKGEPKDGSANPLNLFDRSNIEDNAWFIIAKIYISQKKEKQCR